MLAIAKVIYEGKTYRLSERGRMDYSVNAWEGEGEIAVIDDEICEELDEMRLAQLVPCQLGTATFLDILCDLAEWSMEYEEDTQYG